jgi:Flp pilus assembly pilin Flp
MGRLGIDRRGAAAVEFAFLVPILAVVMFSIVEMTTRFQASEKFNRYSTQTADFLSRTADLTTADVDGIFNQAARMMQPVAIGEGLSLTVSSIGLDDDNGAVLLWQRTKGGEAVEFDPMDAVGLGADGETVLRIDTRFEYTSFSAEMFGLPNAVMERSIYYRPRTTRIISMDGNVSEGFEWNG